MKKWCVVILAFLLIGAAGCYVWNAKNKSTKQSDAVQYTEAKAEIQPIQQEVTCTGTIESNLDVEIKCKASGQIVELPFDISSPVKKGELLLKLDPIDEERTVRQSEVKLASAEAKLARAKQSLLVSELTLRKSSKEVHATLKAAEASRNELRAKAERTATLLEKKYASPEEVESAEASAVAAESALHKASAGIDGLKVDEANLELLRQDIKLAEGDVESYRIDLENAKQRLVETQVYAPISGVISARLVQIGQIIASPTMNVSGGTSLLTLSDLSRIFVLASVDESDVGLVHPKQAATITVDGFPDDTFKGEVVRVATKGTKVSNIVTFEVKIEILDGTKNKLLPQMSADVSILVASNEKALTIPSEAIVRRGADKVVLLPAANGQEPTAAPVKTGIDDDTRVEILSGLEEGATVLIQEEQTEKSTTKEKEGGFGGPPGGGGGPPPM